MYKKLNKDEIKLLRLLSDAYNFGNIADVNCASAEKDGSVAKLKGYYETMDMVNELDQRLVYKICNPISQVFTSMLGEELHNDWVNGSNYDIDHLIEITNSEGV